jgi:glycosyltransferase involved in cell wall biosynthesis
VPRHALDLPLLEHFEIHTLPSLRGHAWEQLTLASFARGAYLLNPSYSAPLFKRRQAITVHDAAVRSHPQSYSCAYRLLNNLSMAILAPRVDTLVTVSQFSARELKTRFGIGRDDVVISRCGSEHVRNDAAIDDRAVLRRHRLVSQGYFLAVGSLKPTKNFGLILRALKRLEAGERLPLAVAGARDASIYPGVGPLPNDTTRWLGYVPDAELNVLYRHAAWFVFPSLYEGFGLPALEAMANGCPVIAADAAAIPEVCGDAALYFDPQDPASLAACLRKATLGPDAGQLRARLRERAASRLAHYTWDASAEILLHRLITVGAVADASSGPTRAPVRRLPVPPSTAS